MVVRAMPVTRKVPANTVPLNAGPYWLLTVDQLPDAVPRPL